MGLRLLRVGILQAALVLLMASALAMWNNALNRRSAALCGTFLTVAVLGCSNGVGGGTCAAIISPPAMVYPSPGASGVSTTIGEIFLSYDKDGTTLSVSGGGENLNGLTTAPAPSPYPSAVPSPAPGQQYAVAHLPTLTSGATYTVTATVPQCTGNTRNVIGSFTTQ